VTTVVLSLLILTAQVRECLKEWTKMCFLVSAASAVNGGGITFGGAQ
jgi:hypothetical protein